MATEFLTFKKFNDEALAGQLTEVLKQNSIEFIVEVDELSFDPSFKFNSELAKEYLVKIAPADFTKAEQAVNKTEALYVNEVEPDHYLFGFTDEELTDVIAKNDEWSNFDQQLARKILADRGFDVSEAVLTDLTNKRLAELSEPAPSQGGLVIVGYITAALGGAIGIFIGWHLANHKRTLPNGSSIYAYSTADRKNGSRIFYLGIVVFVIVMIIKIVYGAD